MFNERIVAPPKLVAPAASVEPDGWSGRAQQEPPAFLVADFEEGDEANSGIRREPELPEHVAIFSEMTERGPREEFAIMDDEP